MEDKHFDHIAKEKLGRFQAEYDPNSWRLLEQRLDTEMAGTPEVNEEEWDEAVFDKLHRFQVPYNSGHWNRMSARLEQEFALTGQLIRYKLLEIGLVALLLLTILQYLPYADNQPFSPTNDEKLQLIPTERAAVRPDKEPSAVNQTNKSTASLEENSEKSVDSKKYVKAQPLIAGRDVSDWKELDRNQEGKATNTVPTAKAFQNRIERFQLTALGNPFHASVKLLEKEKDVLFPQRAEDKIPTEIQNPEYAVPQESFLTADLPSLEPNALSWKMQSGSTILEPQLAKRKTYFRVSMFGGADYNRVYTPADEALGLAALSRYTAGYGGGLTLGLEFNRFEVETGFIYAAKQYKARPILYFEGNFKDGYLGQGVKDIEINIVNIPLNFRYNFIRSQHWRLYMLAGASLQVAAQANYYTSDQDGFRSSSFAPVPAPSAYGPGNQGAFKTLADELPGGLLEGGSFKENGYLTGNLGLGLERYFSGQWSVFLQPTYQHSINYFLDGLGPTRDRINTISLYTGIRLRLRKK